MHVSDVINPDNKRSNKNFGHTLNLRKNEQYSIPTLEKNHQMIADNLSKANILNDQFSSVCRENIPTPKVPSFPTIQPLHNDTQGVCTLLCELDPYKAPVQMVYHHDC